MTEKKLIKNIINCGGYCKTCKEQQIEYGVNDSYYWYYCHKCKKFLQPYPEVLIKID